MLLESFRIITKTSSFLGARILRFHGSGLCKVVLAIPFTGLTNSLFIIARFRICGEVV